MIARFIANNFFSAVLIFILMGALMGIVGIQIIAFYTTAVHVFGTGGGVSG